MLTTAPAVPAAPSTPAKISRSLKTIIPLGQLPAEGLVRLPQILAVLSISKSTFYAGQKSGRYPKPTKTHPGARTAVYRVQDIRALIASMGGDHGN